MNFFNDTAEARGRASQLGMTLNEYATYRQALYEDYKRTVPVPPSHLLAAHLRAQAYVR